MAHGNGWRSDAVVENYLISDIVPDWGRSTVGMHSLYEDRRRWRS